MSSMDGEDSVPNFRRNLMVFCSLVLAGWFLGIPVSAIVQKIVGINFEPISALRLTVVQTLAFLYFSHRYYTSPLGLTVYRDFLANYRSERDSRTYKLALGATLNFHETQTEWSPLLAKSRAQTIEEVNLIRVERSSLEPFDPERMSVEFGPPERKANEVMSFATRVRFWSSNQRFGDPVSISIDINIPPRLSWRIRLQSLSHVLMLSNFLTEQIVPMLLTFGTILLLVFRWYVCLTGYVHVEACLVA